jgi:hypothetical protein
LTVGQGANSHSGPDLPTAVPSGQIFASAGHATRGMGVSEAKGKSKKTIATTTTMRIRSIGRYLFTMGIETCKRKM